MAKQLQDFQLQFATPDPAVEANAKELACVHDELEVLKLRFATLEKDLQQGQGSVEELEKQNQELEKWNKRLEEEKERVEESLKATDAVLHDVYAEKKLRDEDVAFKIVNIQALEVAVERLKNDIDKMGHESKEKEVERISPKTFTLFTDIQSAFEVFKVSKDAPDNEILKLYQALQDSPTALNLQNFTEELSTLSPRLVSLPKLFTLTSTPSLRKKSSPT